jgi:hypothetical protein
VDRRQFDREPTNIQLYARVGAGRSRRLRARDISTEGIFVEGWTPAPHQGAEVSLTFLIGEGPVVKLLSRSARVARVTDQGVGLVHGRHAGGTARRYRARPSPWSSLSWPEVD